MTGGQGADTLSVNNFRNRDGDIINDFEVGIDVMRMQGVENLPASTPLVKPAASSMAFRDRACERR